MVTKNSLQKFSDFLENFSDSMGEIVDLAMRAVIDSFGIYTINSWKIFFLFLTILTIWKIGDKEQRLVNIPLKNHCISENT